MYHTNSATGSTAELLIFSSFFVYVKREIKENYNVTMN